MFARTESTHGGRQLQLIPFCGCEQSVNNSLPKTRKQQGELSSSCDMHCDITPPKGRDLWRSMVVDDDQLAGRKSVSWTLDATDEPRLISHSTVPVSWSKARNRPLASSASVEL